MQAQKKNATMRLLICLALMRATYGATTAKEVEIKSLLGAGHFKQAKRLVAARLQKNPEDAEALNFMASIYQAAGDLDSAIHSSQQAVNLQPENAAYHEKLGEVYGNKAEKVSMFSALKFARLIKIEGERALQLDPKLSDAYELLIQYELQAPGIAGGDKNKAYELLDQLFQVDPCRGNLLRGQLAAKDKQSEKAETYYKNAVLSDPKSYDAQDALANWYVSANNFAATEKVARDTLAIDNGRESAYTVLATIYATQQRWSDLDAILAEAEKNVPDDLTATYQAGRILMLSGKDLPRAEKYFKRYLTQEPEIGAPTLAHAHWRLGLVFEKEGRKPEAAREVQTAVNLKPDLDDAKKDLKRLK